MSFDAPSSKKSRMDLSPESKSETNPFAQLPREVFQMIVDRMDIVTRTRFKQCSKGIKFETDITPLHLKSVVASTTHDSQSRKYTHMLSLDNWEKKETRGGLNHQYVHDFELGADPSDEIVSIFYKVISGANVHIKTMRTSWPCVTEVFGAGHSLKVEHLYLDSCDPENYKSWLDHLSRRAQSIMLVGNDCVFGNEQNQTIQHHEMVRKAEKIWFNEHIHLSEHFLLTCQAEKIDGREGSGYSPAFINRLIKKWITEDYPIGSEFRLNVLRTDEDEDGAEVFDEAGVLRDLRHAKRTRSSDNKVIITVRTNNINTVIELSPIDIYRATHALYPYPRPSWSVLAKVLRVPPPVDTTSPNWKDLPLNIKSMVVSNMDFFTRTCLKLCSKSDRDLVESTPMYFAKLVVGDSKRGWGFQLDDVMAMQSQERHVLISDKQSLSMHKDHIWKKEIPLEDDMLAYEHVLHKLRQLALDDSVKVGLVVLTSGNHGIGNWPLMRHAQAIYIDNIAWFNMEFLEIPNIKLTIDHHSPPGLFNLFMKKWKEQNAEVGSYVSTWFQWYPSLAHMFVDLTWIFGAQEGVFNVHMDSDNKFIQCTLKMLMLRGSPQLKATIEVVPMP